MEELNLTSTLLNLSIVLFLIAANGFFVAAEFALVSVRSTRVDQLVEEGNRMARIIQRAKNDPNRFLSAAQIGITLASLALGWVAEPTVATLLMAGFHAAHIALPEAVLHTIATTITFVMITYMHIVLGESIPKGFALNRTEPTVLLTALPMEWMAIITTPFIHVLNKSGNWLMARMGIEATSGHHMVYTEEELKRIVTASHEVGILEAEEQAMLHKVFAFSDRVAREVMVPRPDIKFLSVDVGWKDLLHQVREHAHTRFPVFEDSIDNVLGVFHTKDLFAFLDEKDPEAFSMRELIREVMFVPENKSVDDLLTEFKKGRTQIAIVMDEFGGTAGLVTLEDLLEEIVGEIEDEFDEPEPDVEQISARQYRLDGGYRIADFNERFGAEFSTEDFDTMAGLVFGALGREPLLNDEVTLERFYLRVEQMEGHRITRLYMSYEEQESADSDEIPPRFEG
jgi:CBS domain containing-hemolysin-like protein